MKLNLGDQKRTAFGHLSLIIQIILQYDKLFKSKRKTRHPIVRSCLARLRLSTLHVFSQIILIFYLSRFHSNPRVCKAFHGAVTLSGLDTLSVSHITYDSSYNLLSSLSILPLPPFNVQHKLGWSLYLSCTSVNCQEWQSKKPKCSCYLSPGGWATRHLYPLTD